MLILSPPIPGNFGGASCGTLGGLNYLGDEILAMTYQRKNSYFNGKYNDKNEVEIAFFFSNFTKKLKRFIRQTEAELISSNQLNMALIYLLLLELHRQILKLFLGI